MSTNYKWRIDVPAETTLPTGEVFQTNIDDCDPKLHLGKLTAGRFIWAQDPVKVLEVCRQRPDEALIEDEYGEVETCETFSEWVEKYRWDMSFIGVAFS
jgi:hypothetical protein